MCVKTVVGDVASVLVLPVVTCKDLIQGRRQLLGGEGATRGDEEYDEGGHFKKLLLVGN